MNLCTFVNEICCTFAVLKGHCAQSITNNEENAVRKKKNTHTRFPVNHPETLLPCFFIETNQILAMLLNASLQIH